MEMRKRYLEEISAEQLAEEVVYAIRGPLTLDAHLQTRREAEDHLTEVIGDLIEQAKGE